jgi:hypothetical protein
MIETFSSLPGKKALTLQDFERLVRRFSSTVTATLWQTQLLTLVHFVLTQMWEGNLFRLLSD